MTLQDAVTDDARAAAVARTIDAIRDIERHLGVTRAALARMQALLEDLAAQKELFPRAAFPPPDGPAQSLLYTLSRGEDGRFALYLNSITPGRKVGPHNHMTWAIVCAVDGAEKNQLYTRTDDGSVPGKATIKPDREHVVDPGNGLAFMPEDIHSISVDGDKPTLHLHMYGQALETLTDRVAFNVATGTCKTLPPPTNIRN